MRSFVCINNSAVADVAVQSIQIFTVNVCYLSLVHFFSVTSKSITLNHLPVLLKTGFFGLHFCPGQFESNLKQCDVLAPNVSISMKSHVAQSCYSVMGDKPFLCSYAKFDPP